MFLLLKKYTNILFLFSFAILNLGVGILTLPPMDRDEPRFAQASKQMIQSGDYIDIKFQNEVRYKKPIGIYWIQSFTVTVLSTLFGERVIDNISAYRVPSFVAVVMASMVVYATGLLFLTRSSAFLSALIFISVLLPGIEARLAKTDAILMLSISCCVFAIAKFLFESHLSINAQRLSFLLFWVSFSWGFLLKGPIILGVIVPLCIFYCYKKTFKEWREFFKPFYGMCIFLLIVLPWFVLLYQKSGMLFFSESVGKDMIAKVQSVQESHGGFFGFFLILGSLLFFPFFWFFPIIAFYVRKLIRDSSFQFLCVWFIPFWFILELIPTKLIHYILPVYPALALMIGVFLDKIEWKTVHNGFKSIVFLIPLVFICITLGVYFKLGAFFPDFNLSMIILYFLSLSLFVSGSLIVFFSDLKKGIVFFSFGVVFFSWFFYPFFGDLLNKELASVKIATMLNTYKDFQKEDCLDAKVFIYGYNEPSLIFLLGKEVQPIDDLVYFYTEKSSCPLLIKVNDIKMLKKEKNKEPIVIEGDLLSTVNGFNLAKGNFIKAELWRKK